MEKRRGVYIANNTSTSKYKIVPLVSTLTMPTKHYFLFFYKKAFNVYILYIYI